VSFHRFPVKVGSFNQPPMRLAPGIEPVGVTSAAGFASWVRYRS
jgi:hypothetical protein